MMDTQESLTLEEIAKLVEGAKEWTRDNCMDLSTTYHGVVKYPNYVMVHVSKLQYPPNEPATFSIDVGVVLPSMQTLGTYEGTEDSLRQIYELAETKFHEYGKKEEVVDAQTNLRNDILSRVRESLKEVK